MLLPNQTFPDTITVEKYLGVGGYGPIYDDPRELPARIRYGNKLVRDGNGEEIVSSAEVLLPAAVHDDIRLASRVTLPLDGTNKRRVVSGGPVMGWRELSHLQYDIQ